MYEMVNVEKLKLTSKSWFVTEYLSWLIFEVFRKVWYLVKTENLLIIAGHILRNEGMSAVLVKEGQVTNKMVKKKSLEWVKLH